MGEPSQARIDAAMSAISGLGFHGMVTEREVKAALVAAGVAELEATVAFLQGAQEGDTAALSEALAERDALHTALADVISMARPTSKVKADRLARARAVLAGETTP